MTPDLDTRVQAGRTFIDSAEILFGMWRKEGCTTWDEVEPKVARWLILSGDGDPTHPLLGALHLLWDIGL